MPRISIEEALRDINSVHMVIVLDSERRKNQGGLVMAAEKVTPKTVNFIAMYARGLICLPLTAERIRALGLPMIPCSKASHQDRRFTATRF